MSTGQNPYQPPAADTRVIGVKGGSRKDVKRVAQYQKGVIMCILIQLIVMVSQFAVPADLLPILSAGLVIAGIASTVFVLLLAMKVYSPGLGVLLGILALVPCVALIVLLIVNGKATDVLRQNGVRVGLFGANLAQI